MIGWKMAVVTFLYFWIAKDFYTADQIGLGIAYLMYALANIGLYLAGAGI